MPKIFLHYPQGAFTAKKLETLAGELTTLGLRYEHIPEHEYTRSTVWIYAREYPSEQVFIGGRSGGTPVVSVEVNAFEGGLDETAKQNLIRDFTLTIGKSLEYEHDARLPVFVVIREVPASDWGIFGKQTSLEALRHPAADALPI